MILGIISVVGGLILLLFGTLPHGRGTIPLQPVFGRLAGMLLIVGYVLRDSNILNFLGFSGMEFFAVTASISMLFLFLGMLTYKVRK